MIGTTSFALLAVLCACIAFKLYHRATRFSIKHIRGPSRMFWLGNASRFLLQDNVGDFDFQYIKEYGKVWRIGGPFGEDVLMIADPKALQHVFHKSGYDYPKVIEADVIAKMITGHSILWASGDVHARHRKVMNPAFSAPQLRSFLPHFRRSANKLCSLWKSEIFALGDDLNEKSDSNGEVVSVNAWLTRLTLDVIGETAFQFPFGALDKTDNGVTDTYRNMFVDSQLRPPAWTIIFRSIFRYLPMWLLNCVPYLPTRECKRFRRTLKVMHGISESLVDEAMKESQEPADVEAQDGKDRGKRDVMRVLVRASMSENPATRLSKEEMISQMMALTLAGHETTANTLNWLLWELSKHPDVQEKLRTEIRTKRQEIKTRVADEEEEGPDFRMDDLENMPYLQAVLKEVLRFHPVVYHLVREAAKDDVIPLSEPIISANGEVLNEIPVSKGQALHISICAYNRLESVWGSDAGTFDPTRFMSDSDNKPNNTVKVGMYANLMTFSAGVRGCIGWRYALIEMLATTAALVENFEFSLPVLPAQEGAPEILRMPCGMMVPMIRGNIDEGMNMPLRVKALAD